MQHQGHAVDWVRDGVAAPSCRHLVPRTPTAESAARRQIQLETNTATAMVRGDRDLLDILLRNLADNAIRYSPAQSRVAISCAQHGQYVALAVNNQGVGVRPEERAHF